MKRILCLLLLIFIGLSANAKGKVINVITDEQINYFNKTVDNLIKKMYGGAFLSPQDTSNLIGIKIKLDDAMLIQPDSKYAPIYLKIGNIYQKRGNNSEAIECYETIIENFSDTALTPKAIYYLKQMGITVKLPSKNSENDEE